MTIKIELNKKVACSFTEKDFLRWAKKVYQNEEFSFLRTKKISISIAIVDVGEMRSLNRAWRGQNQPTDVLSFAEYSSHSLKKTSEKNLFLGELILCYPDIAVYARKNNRKIKIEFAEVAIHGFLHLVGLDHGPKMFGLQHLIKESVTA